MTDVFWQIIHVAGPSAKAHLLAGRQQYVEVVGACSFVRSCVRAFMRSSCLCGPASQVCAGVCVFFLHACVRGCMYVCMYVTCGWFVVVPVCCVRRGG